MLENSNKVWAVINKIQFHKNKKQISNQIWLVDTWKPQFSFI